MRCLMLGNFEGRGWDGSITDENHIADALEGLGHDVVRMQREQFVPFKEDYDFVLLSQWDGYPGNLITSIKTHSKSPVVYWAFDYQADGQEWHERLVSGADLYLSKRIADSKYPNWQWLSQDFSPEFLNSEPNTSTVKDIDVLFTGSYLPWATERNETLKAIDGKFNLTIHSVTPQEWIDQGLKTVNGPIMDERLPELYSRAKINLSIDHTIEAGYWSDRNAQIMACGGFVLFRYIPLSEVAYRRGVKYFYSVEDCLAKIEKYLVWTDAERNQTAMIGHIEVADHLYAHHRVQDLITIVEGIL